MNFLSQLTGLFAHPAAENPTVAMIEAAYQHHNLDWRYLTCEVTPKNLEDAVKGARAMNWKGFNCSLPHKVEVIKYLDSLSESAKIIGAVNCVVRRGDKLIGENTDGKGFLQSLTEKIDPKNKSVIIFGAGGAARAIGVEIALAGASNITIVNRNQKRGNQLAQHLNSNTPATVNFTPWLETYDIPKNTNILINATSIGLYPDVNAKLNINLDTLTSNTLVADVIPNPPQTNLIKDANAKNCTTLDGLGMLVNQGVIGIKYWANIDVDPTIMKQKLEQIFTA